MRKRDLSAFGSESVSATASVCGSSPDEQAALQTSSGAPGFVVTHSGTTFCVRNWKCSGSRKKLV